jgi:hypothetical protein
MRFRRSALAVILSLLPQTPGQAVARRAERPGPELSGRHLYTPAHMRAVAPFGVRLGMRLDEARAILVRRGMRRSAYRVRPTNGHEPRVLEADYRHPVDNTNVALFYAELPNGGRRVSRIFVWEEIPVIPRIRFDTFLAARYGRPTLKEYSQGHANYTWSQTPVTIAALQSSFQCLSDCLPPDLMGRCSLRTVSRQIVMTGVFNTNMAGHLYWAFTLDDLELQRDTMFRRGIYPGRPLCVQPVV